MPERLLRLGEDGSIQLVMSDAIAAEVAKVLGGGKFAWPQAQIEQAMRLLSRISERVSTAEPISVTTADPTDNRILECAETGKANFIVSGDSRHLLPLGSHSGIPIIKVADFLRRFEANAGGQC